MGKWRRDSEARPLTYNPSVACSDSSPFRGAQLVKKGFDKLVDGDELVTKARTNEKVVRESSGEQLLKGYRGEIAQRLMNTASVVEQQVFRNRI